MLRLGWKASPEQYPPEELLEYAVMADDSGFESINVSDHFHPWSEAGQSCFTWSWLGAAAVLVKRVELGVGVTAPILRYHPAVIAQAAATVDNFAPAPTWLGIGTGEALNDYAATGLWPGYSERQDMVREAIELIRALWSGREVTHTGTYYLTRKARLYTPPKRRIPIYISTMVPESASFAGMYGDGMVTGGGKPIDFLKKIISNFEEGARKAGKDPSKMPRLIEYNVSYTDDVEAALKPMREYWLGTLIHAMYNQNIYTPGMSAMNGAVVGDDTLKKGMCITTDPEEHAKFAQRYIDAGFTHLFFHTAGPDQVQFIREYGRKVLPIIRQNNAKKLTA